MSWGPFQVWDRLKVDTISEAWNQIAIQDSKLCHRALPWQLQPTLDSNPSVLHKKRDLSCAHFRPACLVPKN